MSCIDVIVPCYRYGHFLRECVQSILNQEGVGVRVLILDDASPDNTPEVCRQLAQEDTRVSFIRHRSNKGHIATYNEGIEWASEKYCLLLSADDYLLPGASKRAIDIMDANPEVGFAFGNVIELSERGEQRAVRVSHKLLRNAKERILTGPEFIRISGARNIVPTPTAVVRTDLQQKLGGYRSELPHTGDMEMWLRLAAHASVGFVGPYQAVYRRHSDNMSNLYVERSWSGDLEQRRLALDLFFEECGHRIAGAKQVRAAMLKSLSRDAIGKASWAFNERETALSAELAEFALKAFPGVRRSLPWAKLAVKRQLGVRGWSALRPIVRTLRSLRT